MSLSLLVLLSAAGATVPRMPVVGGEPAPEGAWPDAAAVVLGGRVSCSGVLVAPDVVLTAGHCDTGITEVILDTVDHEVDGERIAVVSTERYPDHWNTLDVAALILEEESAVPPRPLALDCLAEVYLEDGAPVAVVGYGATDEWADEFGTVLLQGFTTVVDADCSDLSRGCNAAVSPGGELVAGGDGVDSCTGDSGGPLYLLTEKGDLLAGLTARAAQPADAPCGDGGIYVRADAIAEWVEEVTGRTLERPDCTGMNRRPQPTAERMEVRAGETGTTTVLPNDPDADDRHAFVIGSLPSAGEASVDEEGVLTYRADAAFAGDDAVTVVVSDDGEPALSAELTVPIRVEAAIEDTGVAPKNRCGCRTGATGGFWPLALLVGARVRRRRR